MNDARRARPGSDGAWDRARRAYRAVLADADPAADLLAAGALDLRPGHTAQEWDPARLVVCSGSDDLRELRAIVADATGIGTWPSSPAADATEGDEIRARVDIERSSSLLGLLIAMDGLIERRSPWGRWRSMVDTMAARVTALDSVEIHLRVVEPTD
ncbi:MAG: hypothetical protein DHS20C19_21920 [Acidimicrobiales bacterium]|nr:MAG: hypothetical protein DHS20C19_21920 [Acidimicrobiales bacterium]